VNWDNGSEAGGEGEGGPDLGLEGWLGMRASGTALCLVTVRMDIVCARY